MKNNKVLREDSILAEVIKPGESLLMDIIYELLNLSFYNQNIPIQWNSLIFIHKKEDKTNLGSY